MADKGSVKMEIETTDLHGLLPNEQPSCIF